MAMVPHTIVVIPTSIEAQTTLKTTASIPNTVSVDVLVPAVTDVLPVTGDVSGMQMMPPAMATGMYDPYGEWNVASGSSMRHIMATGAYGHLRY